MKNIVEFPNELGRLFEDARRAVAMGAESKQKFIEGKLLLSASLAAIRARFSDNEAFGKSCAEHGLGENVINKNDRAYLIQWAERPEWTRTVLEKTERTSVRYIHEKEWLDDSLPHVGKSPGRSPSAGGGPKLQEAIDACLAYEAMHGKLPPANRHFDIGLPGITESTYDRAIRAIISGRELAETLGPLKSTKAQAHHIEMMVKLEVKNATEQLNASFEKEVEKRNKADIDRLFPDLEKLREDARRNEKMYRELIAKNALFTEREVMDIVKACHPDDSASKEVRQRAFIAINAKKLILMGRVQ